MVKVSKVKTLSLGLSISYAIINCSNFGFLLVIYICMKLYNFFTFDFSEDNIVAMYSSELPVIKI